MPPMPHANLQPIESHIQPKNKTMNNYMCVFVVCMVGVGMCVCIEMAVCLIAATDTWSLRHFPNIFGAFLWHQNEWRDRRTDWKTDIRNCGLRDRETEGQGQSGVFTSLRLFHFNDIVLSVACWTMLKSNRNNKKNKRIVVEIFSDGFH